MSFKVICIDAKATYRGNDGKLEEGVLYTVIGDSRAGYDGITGYFLAEVKSCYPEYGFRKCRFVRIDGPCEKEIAQEREAASLEESMKEMFQPVEMPAEAMDRVWKGIVRELDKMENA